MASEGDNPLAQGDESLASTVDAEGESGLLPPQPPTKVLADSATVPTTPTTEAPSISFASSSPSTPSQSYANLSYAPRQSPMAHARRLGTSTPTPRPPGDAESRKPLPAEPAANVVVTPAEGSADAQARDEAAAKAEEKRRMMDEALAKCKDLGLSPHTSPGWPLLLKLAEAADGEWKELANLVSQGDATLLLPLSSKSSSAAPKGTLGPAGIAAAEEALPPPSLSYAHDHILIGANARPGPSSTSSAAMGSTSKGFATLSGLRGIIEEDHQSTPSRTKLTIKTFVCRRDRSWVGELKNKGMRRQLFNSLPPLPKASCTDYPFPNYTLSTDADLEVPVATSPPPVPPRPRAGSAASLTAPGLGLGPPSPGPRASTSGSTFATLFGGSGRANKGRASAANEGGSSAPESADITADAAAASTEVQPAARSRTIHVVLIDRPLRRSRALRGMTYSIQARVRTALEREANVPPEIGEEVGNFASAFYPAMESASSGQGGGSVKGARKTTGGVRDLLPAIPYTAQPDHLQMSFQSLYTQVQKELQEHHRKTSGWDDEQTIEATIRKQLESVEALLIEEVYDRIFCPSHSSDQYSDENLASRIAALNVLGLDWNGLGISLPSQGDSNGDDIRRGLDSILASCEAELRMLQTPDCFTPRRKLDVLVSLHRIIVDGLAKLPAIKLKDGNEADEKEAAASEWDEPAQPSSKPGSGNTTSADLILPVLIRLLIKANPPSLNSHLLFIQRYRSEALLREGGGETAYCLINFQAAVQFIENAKPADLGLDDAGRGIGLDTASSSTFSAAATSAASASADADAGSGSRRSAIELLKNVSSAQQQQQEQQQRPAQQQSLTSGAVIGGVAGRMKGLTGVVNSSFSVLGKVIGSGASAGMEAWDRSSKNMDGIRTLDDIRSLLGRGGVGGPLAANNAAPAPTTAVAAAAAVGRGVGGTDYGKEDVSGWDAPLPAHSSTAAPPPPAAPVPVLSSSASSPSSKSSLSDRFASLNRRLASPAAPEQTLPATSPPTVRQAPPQRPPLLANGGASASSGTLGRSTLGLTTRATAAASQQRDPITSTAASALPASLRSPYPPLPRPPTAQRPLHVVLASSGSVASIKVPLIVEALLALGHVRVQVVATKSSLHFYKEEDVKALGGSDGSAYTVKDLAAENLAASRGETDEAARNPTQLKRPRCHVWRDEDEWSSWDKVGDAILHIELRRWADIVLVAPCSANCLAKIAGGLCDNLLTSFLRALDPSTPTLLFPAMNTLMYLHPLTARHLDVAQRVLGYEVHGPIEKRLACGDLGSGAMLEWTDIVELVRGRFGLPAGGGGDVGQKEEEGGWDAPVAEKTA